MATVTFPLSWRPLIEEEFTKPYFDKLVQFIKTEKAMGKKIYPPGSLIFNAFARTDFRDLKVVIIGQDPYHGPGEAMGLCFSVPREIRIPPSLKNIFKEIQNDLDISPPQHGDLSYWADQGVLLLNAILTVEHKRPGSHRKKGWETFTDAVIQRISNEKEHVVFLLWGNFARSKKSLIHPNKHLILESPHPSPLARGGFFNNHHFSLTNKWLKNHQLAPIDWDNSKGEVCL